MCKKQSFPHNRTAVSALSLSMDAWDCPVLCHRRAPRGRWERVIGGYCFQTLSPPKGLAFFYTPLCDRHICRQGQGWMNFIGLNVWLNNRVISSGCTLFYGNAVVHPSVFVVFHTDTIAIICHHVGPFISSISVFGRKSNYVFCNTLINESCSAECNLPTLFCKSKHPVKERMPAFIVRNNHLCCYTIDAVVNHSVG